MDYTFQEMPDVHGTGKRKVFPKPTFSGPLGADFIATVASHQISFPAATIKAIIAALTDAMEPYLELGHSVKVDGLGTFTLALGMKGHDEAEEVKEAGERYDTYGVYIKGINFLPDARWLDLLRRRIELHKVGPVRTLHKVTTTREQRLKMALRFLETNPMLRIVDYMAMTGLRRTAARDELHSLADDPTSGIRRTGRGSHLMFMRRTEE